MQLNAAEPEPLLVVCAVIRDTRGRVLAAKRSRSKDVGSKWEFPGGKVHNSESDQEALTRELGEELRIRANDGKFFAETIHQYHFGAVHLKAYLVDGWRGTITPTEHEEIRWLELDQLQALDWAAADLPIVSRLQNLTPG